MLIPGKRVTKERLIQTDRFIVAVQVEAVIPEADPSEPCYESETVQFLKEVQQRAEQGDREWLMQRGRVYERVAA